MSGPTSRRLWNYAVRRPRLKGYFRSPGDGRRQPQIPPQALLRALLVGQILRECSFHAIEALVRSPARRNLCIAACFGDDALGYFTQRLDPGVTRQALIGILRRAKRNKAFDDCRWIGLAVDGTGTGWRTRQGCSLCRPQRNAAKRIVGYQHRFVMASAVGTGLALPFDAEPYEPGDSEYAAGQRVLQRAIGGLGKRFAQYVVVDGEFATAPFLYSAGDLGLHVVARLKENLPELFRAAQQRLSSRPPTASFQHGQDRVEVWDADDFDPWETLRWETVRVLLYRQHKPGGTVVEAYWLTDFPCSKLGAASLFRMAKSRHGIEHICHHHANSLLLGWLIALLALTIERLYRLRYLHRGAHPLLTAAQLVLALWLSLSAPCPADSS